MKTLHSPLIRVACMLLVISTGFACDLPECIDGPSNLTPEAVAECVAPPAGTDPIAELKSAGATLRGDGTLVLTWSSFGLQCGTSAEQVPYPEDCHAKGWALTAEIPPELAVAGIIELAEHPEVLGSMTVMTKNAGGSSGSHDGEPFFVGSIELVDVGEACVSGVLHGFGTGNPDPTLGGPELEGSFMAPRC